MNLAPLCATVCIVAAAVAASRPVSAQGAQGCDVVIDEAPRSQYYQLATGHVRHFAGGGVVAHCAADSTRMRSDSVAYYSDRAQMDFVGQVRFSDSAVTLDADRAVFFLGDERLEAYGNTRLVNRATGSVLSGPNLTYWRLVPGVRDTAELFASRRPTVEYRSATDSAGTEPYVIVARQVRLRGDDLAWAGGSVTIDRSDFHAEGDSARLAMDVGRGDLVGHARVEGMGHGSGSASGELPTDSAPGFEVAGRDIQFAFAGSSLNWVQARVLAEAESEDWRLVADTLEFAIVDDMIQGGLAWGDSLRAVAVSELQTVSADSLAIDTPNQRLRELRGFRDARATSVVDSLDTEVDWITGDTVVARFDVVSTGQRILVGLQAIGNAHALYRIFDVLRGGVPDINYSRGDRIDARFGVIGIEQVDVVGAADGIHLESIDRRRP